MRKIQQCVLAIALALAAGGTVAQDTTPSVEVQGVKNPDMKSYRAVVAGLDAFEEHHALAPTVPELRFRLAARATLRTSCRSCKSWSPRATSSTRRTRRVSR